MRYCVACLGPCACADGATDLLFFSGDLMRARSFGGVGWLHAGFGAGLQRAGVSGRTLTSGTWPRRRADRRRLAVRGIGRFGHVDGGVEVDPRYSPVVNPLASADLWWEPANDWMTAALIQATPDYVRGAWPSG